jgi:hypothetical protein
MTGRHYGEGRVLLTGKVWLHPEYPVRTRRRRIRVAIFMDEGSRHTMIKNLLELSPTRAVTR